MGGLFRPCRMPTKLAGISQPFYIRRRYGQAEASRSRRIWPPPPQAEKPSRTFRKTQYFNRPEGQAFLLDADVFKPQPLSDCGDYKPPLFRPRLPFWSEEDEMIAPRAVCLVVCSCGRIRKYREWVHSPLSLEQMLSIAVSCGVRRLILVSEKCPLCLK